jgi:hypothetical protein
MIMFRINRTLHFANALSMERSLIRTVNATFPIKWAKKSYLSVNTLKASIHSRMRVVQSNQVIAPIDVFAHFTNQILCKSWTNCSDNRISFIKVLNCSRTIRAFCFDKISSYSSFTCSFYHLSSRLIGWPEWRIRYSMINERIVLQFFWDVNQSESNRLNHFRI